MKLINVAIKRRVFTIMVFISIMIVGFVSLGKLSLEFFPEITFPSIIIMTQHDGVGPEEIETTISKVIEGAVASAEGIEKLTAVSKEGISVVNVQFKWGHNLDAAVADLRDKLDLIRDYIPDDATKPIIYRINMSSIPVVMLGMTGDKSLPYLYDLADIKLKDQLEQVKGVASMSIQGARKREVQVVLKRNRLDAYGFTPEQIIGVLRAENLNASGGNIKKGYKQFTIRTEGEFKKIEEIRNVVLSYKNGIPIYLKYVADINWGISEEVTTTKISGKKGLRLVIYKQSGANTVEVVDLVRKRLEKIKQTLPKSIKLVEVFNTADFVKQSISSVAESAVYGGFFAILVVLFFLRNVRASVIISIAIPTSIIGTFIAMYFSGVSLNIVSMGGLALGIGMLVDNAIVVLENNFNFLKRGQKPAEAARLGSEEVAMAIFSSTLTTVCVFLPIAFTEGLAKEIFMEMALTVSFSLLVSLFVSLTLVPMLSSRYLKIPDETFMKRFRPRTFFIISTGERFLNYLDNKYKMIIAWALDHRKTVLISVVAFFIFTFMFILSGLKFEFMPEADEGMVKITAEMPVGTRLKTTNEALDQLGKIVKKVVKKEDLKTQIFLTGSPGGMASIFNKTGSSVGTFRVKLTRKSKRKISSLEYMKRIKAMAQKAPAPLGVAKLYYTTQGGGALMGGGAPIDILVRGYDLKKGAKLAKKLKEVMEKIKGIYNINISRQDGLPEMVVKVNRLKAASLGLNMVSIANAVQQSILGQTATHFREDGREIDIFVRLAEKDRKKVSDIENIQIMSSYTYKPIRLGNVAKIVRNTGPIDIERDNQERVVHVTCSTFRGLQSTVNDIKQAVAEKIIIPSNFSLEYSGNFKDMQDTFSDLGIAMLVAIFLVFAVMASIFESFLDPFIIFFSIPLSFIGVIWTLFLTNTSLNVNSMIGILVLAGIVVNNGIVLIDYINILRERGLNIHDAITEGGRRRLRPILMTSLTTILAMMPLAIGIGEGSESTSPMARAVVGGLFASTFLTLIVIPVIYSCFETFTKHLKEKREARKQRRYNKKMQKYGLTGGNR